MHSEHEVKHEPEVILAVSVNSKIRKQNSLLHNLKIHSPIWTPKTKDNGELNLQIWWPISFPLLSRPTTKLRCWLPERNSSWSRQLLPGIPDYFYCSSSLVMVFWWFKKATTFFCDSSEEAFKVGGDRARPSSWSQFIFLGSAWGDCYQVFLDHHRDADHVNRKSSILNHPETITTRWVTHIFHLLLHEAMLITFWQFSFYNILHKVHLLPDGKFGK